MATPNSVTSVRAAHNRAVAPLAVFPAGAAQLERCPLCRAPRSGKVNSAQQSDLETAQLTAVYELAHDERGLHVLGYHWRTVLCCGIVAFAGAAALGATLIAATDGRGPYGWERWFRDMAAVDGSSSDSSSLASAEDGGELHSIPLSPARRVELISTFRSAPLFPPRAVTSCSTLATATPTTAI